MSMSAIKRRQVLITLRCQIANIFFRVTKSLRGEKIYVRKSMPYVYSFTRFTLEGRLYSTAWHEQK